MLKAAVYGASGYGGVELCRMLLGHPKVELVQVTSRQPGRRLDAVHPGLRGLTDLALSESRPDALDPELDVLFLALPHGESGPLMPAVLERCLGAGIFDLARDFRTGHTEQGWVYGQPELFRSQLVEARRVAAPGCFATSILLATGPMVEAGYRPRTIVVDAKTGSSGSGATAKAVTHHPTRTGTHKAYKVFQHQHEGEIKAAWSTLSPEAGNLSLAFVPQSTPLVRGIYSCCYLVFGPGEAPPDPAGIYRDRYEPGPFVRVLDHPPNVLNVRGTNNADLHVAQTGDVVLVIAAIDNIVRGAGGQAVQAMNLAYQLPEDDGLRLPALIP